MAATKKDRRYHAFLSFRGCDTRLSFVAHLHDKLTTNGIYAFLDDRKLPKGGSISQEIVEAIRDSTLYVVVLSANYASSPWCLDELTEIAEQARSRDGVVVPVFYDIDPSDVEEVSGSFGAAIAEHAASVEEETVRRWRDALTYVSRICGWDSRNRNEADLVSDIVRDVSDKVNCAFSYDSSDLVGIGAHVEEMLKKLYVDSDSVRIVGIWGMGGIGKSTIARVVHDKIRSKFGACCFIADVGHKFLKGKGKFALRKELLSAIFKEKDLTGWPLYDSNIIKKRLSNRNVLVVLDGVDDLRQLQLLAKECNWFGPGSRIIVTTQNRDLLTAHGVDHIYEVEPLATDAALQLFSRCAFKQNQPKDGYLELSHKFVDYAQGNPFALEILGSSQSKKSVAEWEWELVKLKNIPDRAISEMLKVSIDGLDKLEKKVFLDIACFFNGMDKDTVADILDACGFIPERAFKILKSKALISILSNQLNMNELHGQVGQQIVKEESEDPGGRSRLWDADDIRNCLTGSMGSIKVEGIFFDMSKSEIMPLKCEAFTKMSGLRLFNFYHPHYDNHPQYDRQTCNVQLQGDYFVSISQGLKYFRWDAFPAKVLPLGFCAKYLVELHLPYSSIEVLWEEKQSLTYLKVIDLKHSKLKKLPDLSDAKKLKHLNLQNCSSLVDVSSVEHLKMIEYLNLHACSYLNGLPSLAGSEVLTTLDLSDCSILQILPPLPRNLKYVYLTNCTMLTILDESIWELKATRDIDIAGCMELLQLQENTTEGSSSTRLAGHYSDNTRINIVSDAHVVASARSIPVNCTIEIGQSSQAQATVEHSEPTSHLEESDSKSEGSENDQLKREIARLESVIAELKKQNPSEHNRNSSNCKIHEDPNLEVQEKMISESAPGSTRINIVSNAHVASARSSPANGTSEVGQSSSQTQATVEHSELGSVQKRNNCNCKIQEDSNLKKVQEKMISESAPGSTSINIVSNAHVASARSIPVNGIIEIGQSSQAQTVEHFEPTSHLKELDSSILTPQEGAEIDRSESEIARPEEQLAPEQNRKTCCFPIWKTHRRR